MRLSALLVLLDSSFALVAPPVSPATRGLRIAVQAPQSRCTLSHQGEEPQQLLGRRAFTRASLLIALPFSAPSLAVADDCSYAALATLPALLTKVNGLATGDPKVAEDPSPRPSPNPSPNPSPSP